jgi:hypothetical protein
MFIRRDFLTKLAACPAQSKTEFAEFLTVAACQRAKNSGSLPFL